MVSYPTVRSFASALAGGLLVAACAGPQTTTPAPAAANRAQPTPPVATAAPTAAAELPPRDALIAAFQRLKAAPNYSFRTTAETTLDMGDAPTFTRHTTNIGQVQNGGPAVLTLTATRTDGPTRTTHSVRDGDRAAVESDAGTWTVRTPRAPVAADGTPLPRGQLDMFLYQAEHLHNVRREGDAIVGDLAAPDPGVAFDQVPTTAVREIRYWLRDGLLVKQQLHVHLVSRMADGRERKQDQLTTVEYYDVGTTTVTVPPGARTALGL